MALIRVAESDDWIVDYDRERGMYRVSIFEDGHFKDECWFDAYEEKELDPIEERPYDHIWDMYYDEFEDYEVKDILNSMNGIIGNLNGKPLYNVVPYPLDGMIYYVETSEKSDEAWIANKPIQYIDEEGYHCGWGLATLCFKFEDLNEVYFFSREEAKKMLGKLNEN